MTTTKTYKPSPFWRHPRYSLPKLEKEEVFVSYEYTGGNFNPNHPEASILKFLSSYCGQSTYQFYHPTKGEIQLRYRFCKIPWRWNKNDQESQWNFPSREEFEAQINTSHKILLAGNGPVDELTLKLFQEITGHTEAKTGYFCHIRGRFVTCKTPKQGKEINPQTHSYNHRYKLLLREIKNLKEQGKIEEALQLINSVYTQKIENELNKIIPGWKNNTQQYQEAA